MISTLIAATALSLAAPDWRDANAETSAIADPAGLDRLAADFPNSATIQRRILIQAFQAGDKKRALAALGRLREMGYGLSDGAFGQIAAFVGNDEAAPFHQAARWLNQPIGRSIETRDIPPGILLAEGVAHDPVSGAVYVGSVVGRDVHQLGLGAPRRLDDAQLGSVFGLAVDADRRLLWLASGKVDQTPEPDSAFVGLVAIDLDEFEVVARVPAPEGVASLNDIGLADDGTVFAADATGGGIYRLAIGAEVIEEVVAPGRLRGPQGIAVSADGQRAYLADYGYGIAVLDLESGSLERLEGGTEVMLDGVDGLYWSKGSLVAIQNGIRPMRISRLDLDASGTEVVRQVTLARADPAWGEPTLGQVIDDHFIYISDPQWERFGEGGALEGDEPLRPNQIRSLRIR